MAFLMHGIVRAWAGLNIQDPKALRLAQISYAVEFLTFARLVLNGVAPVKPCAPFLVLPLIAIVFFERIRKAAAIAAKKSE